ncbi:MAG: MucB/RseB C-terminal domain-containing protein [Thiohalobacterales bacterium]
MRWLPVLLLVAGPAVAQETAWQWLDDMASAVQGLNYDGTFVYLHDDKLEAMRIIHQLGDTGERERLVALTGSAREVLRNNKLVTCIMPDSKSVMVGQSRPQPPFPVVPDNLGSLEKYYRIEIIGDDRIAGYLTRVIAITPKDSYRYGYRFWIDKESKMFLRSDLTGNDSRPIEQVMFTRLGIGGPIADSELQPSLTGDGYAWYHQDNSKAAPESTGNNPRWIVRRLPAGFDLTNYQLKRMHPDSDATEHLVYSDGLATVSVYVETGAVGADAFRGLSGKGAMNAFGAVVDGHQVTVVGEVPAVTVEMMASSVVARSGGRHD